MSDTETDRIFYFGDFMKILICDDEERYLNEIRLHTEEYLRSHNIKASLYASSNPKEIMNSTTSYDLAFVDVEMPEFDGITLAKELKKRNNKVILFFVTNFEEYQDDAMDLRIFRFFEKPLDIKRLYSSLDRAMEYLDETYVDLFLYNNSKHQKILVDNIVYIKRDNRKTVLFANDEKEYITKETLEQWNERLPNTFFYLVHKSFLINLHYVTKCSYTELYIGKTRIPIASRKQADFHNYWVQYLRRR